MEKEILKIQFRHFFVYKILFPVCNVWVKQVVAGKQNTPVSYMTQLVKYYSRDVGRRQIAITLEWTLCCWRIRLSFFCWEQSREAVVVPIAGIGGGSGSRPNSLPPYVAPPAANSAPGVGAAPGVGPYGGPVQRRPSESSSESEQAGGKSRSGSTSEAKRRGVLSSLFGRKRAAHL